MTKYIFKYFRRSLVSNVLFCLLLTLAGTLLCICAGLWYSAHKALLDLDETITTIAVPDRIAINRRAIELVDENPTYEYEDDPHSARINAIANMETEIFKNIREVIYPSGILQRDTRRLFNTFSDDINPIPLRMTGVGAEPYIASYSGYGVAVFVVTCEIINTEYHFMNNPYWGYSFDEDSYLLRFDSVTFTINEILHHNNSAQTDPLYVRTSVLQYNHDGSAPFEIGKKYIVIGNYQRSTGIGDISLDFPNVETSLKNIGYINDNDELNEVFTFYWWEQPFFDDSYFPMEIKTAMFVREPGEDDGWYSFIEVEGSVEETLASERAQSMIDAMAAAQISSRSFQLYTTGDPNSFVRFNQNRNLFFEGRTFTAGEITEGANVCIISKQVAEHNELEVGDTISLQMYNATLSALNITYPVSEDTYVTETFWIPSMYNSDLEISDLIEFTIVGIYNTLRIDRSEHAIAPNTIFIPDNSISTLDGEPKGKFDTLFQAPLLADAVIIPNGKINDIKNVIDSILPGYGGLFRFYDQGYNSVRLALGNLRFGMSWILVLSAVGWVAVLIIFLLFYVTRKRKEAALLYNIGISRFKRLMWICTQCCIIILASLGISIAVSLPIYGDILDIAAGTAQEFTDSFRDLTLSDAADSGLRSRIPLDRSPLALIITVTGTSVITLVAAISLSARSVTFKSLSAVKEDD